jgi:predicted protein tyrosine phosphatase
MLQYDTQSAIRIARNLYQGDYKRVLCVCSAGILRSATAAVVLSQAPYNFNTRCAGAEKYALVPINDALLVWANEVVCMTREHADKVYNHLLDWQESPKILCLNVPDDYAYRDEELIRLIKQRYDALQPGSSSTLGIQSQS